MESEAFSDRFVKGQMEDSEEFVEWANDYENYLAFGFNEFDETSGF